MKTREFYRTSYVYDPVTCKSNQKTFTKDHKDLPGISHNLSMPSCYNNKIKYCIISIKQLEVVQSLP